MLDKTDLVFIDPVGTGFKPCRRQSSGQGLLGWTSDIKSLAEMITIYGQPQRSLELAKIFDR